MAKDDTHSYHSQSEKMSELFAVCMCSADLLDAVVKLPEFKPYLLAEIDRLYEEIKQKDIKIAALKAKIAELGASSTVLDASQWSWYVSSSVCKQTEETSKNRQAKVKRTK